MAISRIRTFLRINSVYQSWPSVQIVPVESMALPANTMAVVQAGGAHMANRALGVVGRGVIARGVPALRGPEIVRRLAGSESRRAAPWLAILQKNFDCAVANYPVSAARRKRGRIDCRSNEVCIRGFGGHSLCEGLRPIRTGWMDEVTR